MTEALLKDLVSDWFKTWIMKNLDHFKAPPLEGVDKSFKTHNWQVKIIVKSDKNEILINLVLNTIHDWWPYSCHLHYTHWRWRLSYKLNVFNRLISHPTFCFRRKEKLVPTLTWTYVRTLVFAVTLSNKRINKSENYKTNANMHIFKICIASQK